MCSCLPEIGRLLLQENCKSPQRCAGRESAGVAHKYLSRRCVEPEKTDATAIPTTGRVLQIYDGLQRHRFGRTGHRASPHVDDNCVNGADEGLATSTFFLDADDDTYGLSNNSIVRCGGTGHMGMYSAGICLTLFGFVAKVADASGAWMFGTSLFHYIEAAGFTSLYIWSQTLPPPAA